MILISILPEEAAIKVIIELYTPQNPYKFFGACRTNLSKS
jgi:hypothetical protein